MKRLFALISFVLVVMVGCNGALRVQAPEITAVIMDVTYVTVFWEKNNIIENNSDFGGYNVYVYTDSNALMVEDGEELNKFNSQLIQDTTYQINGLLQDSIYYIQIRTVNTDAKVGDYNSTTPFLQASPRPEFTVTMNIASAGQPVTDSCAIRFSDALVMADSTMPDSGADMWVGTLNDTLLLRSPNSHSLYGANARVTYFSNHGPGDFDSLSQAPVEPDAYAVDFLAGDVVVAKTEDGNYVKIYVTSIDIQNNAVTILYAYQNVAEFPYF
ncbi:MAG: fibronectin type III domain-containing protein [bacterium]